MHARFIIEISLKDYYTYSDYCTAEIIELDAFCGKCMSSGFKDRKSHFCSYCHGGKYKYKHTCKYCNGTGKMFVCPEIICDDCKGKGRVNLIKTDTICLPKDINETYNKFDVRIKDFYGCYGPSIFRVVDDDTFTHKGNTLYYTCNITQEEADNGVCKDIDIYGDIIHVYTRDCIQSYDKYVATGKGIRGGDLIITFRIVNPNLTVDNSYTELQRVE